MTTGDASNSGDAGKLCYDVSSMAKADLLVSIVRAGANRIENAHTGQCLLHATPFAEAVSVTRTSLL